MTYPYRLRFNSNKLKNIWWEMYWTALKSRNGMYDIKSLYWYISDSGLILYSIGGIPKL